MVNGQMNIIGSRTNPIDDYRYQDGTVSVCYSKRAHIGKYRKGHGGIFGIYRPEIMHIWEFEYLLKHPDFANFWMKNSASKHLEEFDAEQFLNALTKEADSRSKNKK